MTKITRKGFIGTSLAIAGAAAVSRWPMDVSALPVPAKGKLPLGFQVWTINADLQKDFAGTLAKMAGLGYKTVEMCSPPGYGWKSLEHIKPKEMRKIVREAGLELASTHYGMKEFRDNLDERIEFAEGSGQKQMVLSSFGLPAVATLDDWKKAADELNQMGLKTKKEGIQMGFHNHHGEFGQLEGKLIYDVLMERFDPELVKMQFQVAVISIGYKAADYFNKYPGRFISAHLADWSPDEKKNVAMGKGIVDWKEFFEAAKIGGVKNIFVEMDPETFKGSAEYCRGDI